MIKRRFKSDISEAIHLKVAKAIDEIHHAQCRNYPKATGLHLCLLLNFGTPRLEIKRIVLALCPRAPSRPPAS